MAEGCATPLREACPALRFPVFAHPWIASHALLFPRSLHNRPLFSVWQRPAEPRQCTACPGPVPRRRTASPAAPARHQPQPDLPWRRGGALRTVHRAAPSLRCESESAQDTTKNFPFSDSRFRDKNALPGTSCRLSMRHLSACSDAFFNVKKISDPAWDDDRSRDFLPQDVKRCPVLVRYHGEQCLSQARHKHCPSRDAPDRYWRHQQR